MRLIFRDVLCVDLFPWFLNTRREIKNLEGSKSENKVSRGCRDRWTHGSQTNGVLGFATRCYDGLLFN
jgi:hypothetical protein